MASESILLPRRLGEKLKEKAAETGWLPDELDVEFVRQGLNEELDPEDLVQVSEKLWGASALAVKSVAAKRGLQMEQHGSLWVFVNLLAKESGDKDFNKFFGEANSLHKNFYENELSNQRDCREDGGGCGAVNREIERRR